MCYNSDVVCMDCMPVDLGSVCLDSVCWDLFLGHADRTECSWVCIWEVHVCDGDTVFWL